MDDITAAAVTDFLDYMTEKKGWLPSTRNHRLSCIRSFFNYAACQEPVLYVYADALKAVFRMHPIPIPGKKGSCLRGHGDKPWLGSFSH